MNSSSLIEESLKRLVTQDPYDVVLYLDERGTPAVDRRLITGGVLAYSEADRVSVDWRRVAQSSNLGKLKGTGLSRKELLEVASFVVRQPLLPVAVWSGLRAEELERLQAFSQEYKESKSPKKRFKKISASSWLLKHQMTQAIAYADVSFLRFFGPIGRAVACIDQVTDQPGMPEHYQELLEKNSSWEHVRSVAAAAGVPQDIIELLKRESPERWQVDLNARGPLAQLADIICAMFGRFIDGEILEPWEIVRLRYTKGESKSFPPCMGGDVTWSVRAWLQELYTRGKPGDGGEELSDGEESRAQQRCAADCLQRTLRPRLRQPLTPSVRQN
jgi:hypothetical protein